MNTHDRLTKAIELAKEYCRVHWRLHADEVEFEPPKKNRKTTFSNYKHAKRGI